MLDKPRILSLFPNLFNKFNKNMSTHVRSSIYLPIVTLIITRICVEGGRSIPKPSANRSPYICTLVQKLKHRVYKIHAFLNKRLCKLFNFKKTCTSCTDEVREKVPSFQKVTRFLRYKP